MSEKSEDTPTYDNKRLGRVEILVAEQGGQIESLATTMGQLVKKLDFIATELGKNARTDWRTLAAWTMAILILISMAGWPILDRVKEVRADQKVMAAYHYEETIKLTAEIAKLQENQHIYHEVLPKHPTQ